MTSDSREPAFDWGESDEGLVVEGRDVALAAPRPKTENPVLLAVFGGLYAVWTVAWVLAILMFMDGFPFYWIRQPADRGKERESIVKIQQSRPAA
jgi:hypothetical protein